MCVMAVATVVTAQEQLHLASPVTVTAIADYQVSEIRLRRSDWTIMVWLTPNTAIAPVVYCTWGGMTRTTTTGVDPNVVVTQTPNVGLQCSNGYSNVAAPTGPSATGQALVLALNKTNLSTTSLEKRIYNQLVADGAFAGSVTGSPQ